MPSPWERPGVDAVAELLGSGKNVVFIAPTGYGKSKAVPRLLQEARGEGLAARVIHVLPLRALVKQQYFFMRDFLEKKGCRGCAGYLAGGLGLGREGFSGYMLRAAVVSTLDSFALNIARLPVAELEKTLRGVFEGHYELPRAALASSLVVLDEAHLYAEPWVLDEEPLSRRFLSISLRFLSEARIPLVVETATMATRLVEDIAGRAMARVIAVCKECGKKEWMRVVDRDYFSEHMFRWRTRIMSREEALREAISFAETRRRVLFTANTVDSALDAYRVLSEGLGVDKVVLIHGRLSHRDREEALKRLNKASAIVATQVIEAGVDVDAEVLVSEAAAPSSLAQRAGRLCRSREVAEKCKGEPPEVILYEPETSHPYGDAIPETIKTVHKVLASGKSIEWRLLDNTRADGYDAVSFHMLVETVENQGLEGEASAASAAYRNLLWASMALPLGDPGFAKRLLESYCSLVRGSALVTLAIPMEDEESEGFDTLEVSLEYLSKHSEKVLDCDASGCTVVVLAYGNEDTAYKVMKLEKNLVRNMLKKCRNYAEAYPRLLARAAKALGDKGLRAAQLYLAARRGAYKRGLGLTP
ncbi:hypothetical protein PYJP_06200 [Pyrofollis japonicus]|uniref:CRISPR-associated helicase Cas3' n=1 Tax=Pyrofollis japonicus TaxID=3060460 RepID=UPI00295C298E|nr:CRISPR-associated helicase Cas3' [Pyrofollis japonicus]BEP17268.1 hypothetical protein PYJP_06200 [Pyrofollis japonicus]